MRKIFRRDRRLSDRFQGLRVEAAPVGIVHVVGLAKAPENGLAEPPDKTVFPSTGVRQYVPGNLAQSEGIPGTATSQRRK